MNSKLTILANNKPLSIPDDFSISVELSNPLFNDVEMFSYPVELPFNGNRHFLRNIDDPNSDIRPVSYEHTPMQIIADGVPLASGPAIIQEDEQLKDALSLSIDASTQSFSDLISDLKCNEVPIPQKYHDQLLIGEKIDEVNVAVNYSTQIIIKYQGKKGNQSYGSAGSSTTTGTFSLQALGFSYPAKCEEIPNTTIHEAALDVTRTYPDGKSLVCPKIEESYINVSDSYPTKPFCNARICYGHHDITAEGETSDELVKTSKSADKPGEMFEDRGKIWALEADRPQSGICFYLLFFLDCLFEHLGVQFDNKALTAIGDFRRLAFFTTKCAYNIEPLYYGELYKETDEAVKAGLKTTKDVKVGFFHKKANNEKEVANLFDDVNLWLSSRGCGGKLKLDNPRDKSLQQVTYYPVIYDIVESTDARFPDSKVMKREVKQKLSDTSTTETVGRNNIASITARSTITSAEMYASIFRMYANEQNFPAESVSDVISSLENQFGIKFYYDYEQKKVTAYLIRDVFRKQSDAPRTFHAEMLSMVPITEKITGVRAGYSAESESKEQKDNIKNAIKDYNTDYDYIEYPKDRTVTSLKYDEIIHQIHNGQMKLFIDLQTGNKYRVKIDSDFSSVDDMKPRLFEVGQYKGVEIGDCSTLNEDFVVEMKSDFVPVGMVDINYYKTIDANSSTDCFTDSTQQPTSGTDIEGKMVVGINEKDMQNIYAAFIDEDMEHEFITQYIKNPISSLVADFYLTEELSLRESYDPSSTDDGNSPLQSYDWGLSIAIMRGGGVDSSHEAYDYDYDGFGNSKWRTTVGEYAMTTDSVDCYGNVYDYNGVEPGIGNEERFSLKPRAWVQPKWASSPLVVDDPLIKNRGYVDTCLIDYIYFLLNRKKYHIECICSVAQIVDIQNHWKEWWIIDGKKCLINKVNADITAKDGLGKVELVVYSL